MVEERREKITVQKRNSDCEFTVKSWWSRNTKNQVKWKYIGNWYKCERERKRKMERKKIRSKVVKLEGIIISNFLFANLILLPFLPFSALLLMITRFQMTVRRKEKGMFTQFTKSDTHRRRKGWREGEKWRGKIEREREEDDDYQGKNQCSRCPHDHVSHSLVLSLSLSLNLLLLMFFLPLIFYLALLASLKVTCSFFLIHLSSSSSQPSLILPLSLPLSISFLSSFIPGTECCNLSPGEVLLLLHCWGLPRRKQNEKKKKKKMSTEKKDPRNGMDRSTDDLKREREGGNLVSVWVLKRRMLVWEW